MKGKSILSFLLWQFKPNLVLFLITFYFCVHFLPRRGEFALLNYPKNNVDGSCKRDILIQLEKLQFCPSVQFNEPVS